MQEGSSTGFADNISVSVSSQSEKYCEFLNFSASWTQIIRKFKPTTFEDIFAAVALFRPGPMHNIDSYIRRKQGKEEINYLHPDLEEILKPK